MSDMASVISANILKLYANPYNPSNVKPAKLSRILQAKIVHNVELLAAGLNEINVGWITHIKNVRLAEETIYNEYENRDMKTVLTPTDFAEVFFRNKEHKSYQALIPKLSLNNA